MQNHYENDFGVSSAVGAGNTKIGFLKAQNWAGLFQEMVEN